MQKDSVMCAEVHSSDLFNYALLRPLKERNAPDSLKIVSGYASYAMASRHVIESRTLGRRLDVDLVYGMAGVDGVSKANHLGFLSLAEHREFQYDGTFRCSYVMRPKSVHSKVYVWCRDGIPVKAFIGSANYTESGFALVGRTETLAECDPTSALDFFNGVKETAIPCQSADRDADFSPRTRGGEIPADFSHALEVETDEASPYRGCLKVVIPLINRKGNLGDGSGLNWGVMADGTPRLAKKGKANSFRNPNEAYIRVPKKIAMTGFFPEYNANARRREEQKRFTVVTDDGEVFSCVRTSGGFGKEIETPQDNSELGRYFRKRLGLPDGAYVDVMAMKRHGRFDVTFYKIDEESYAMDFSPKRLRSAARAKRC